jgi:hypothetical protein
MAMMVMTTRSSIRVKPCWSLDFILWYGYVMELCIAGHADKK